MASQVFEDALDLYIDLLEVVPEVGNSGEEHTWKSSPFPNVVPTGQSESRRFRTIILENEYLRLTLVPALGGRLLSVYDKRFSHECLRGWKTIKAEVVDGTSMLPFGVVFSGCKGTRANSLGSTDSMLLHPQDEGDAAEVIVAEVHSGSEISHQIRYILPPASNSFRMEVTVQNRSNKVVHGVHPSISVFGSNSHFSDTLEFCKVGDLAFTYVPGSLVAEAQELTPSVDFGSLSRTLGWMSPRQVDSFSISVYPLPAGMSPTYVGHEMVAELGSELKVCAGVPLLNHKLVVQTQTGDSFEMPVSIHPEKVLEVDLGTVPGHVFVSQVKSDLGVVVGTIPDCVLGREPIEINAELLTPSSGTSSEINFSSLSDGALELLLANAHHRVGALIEMASRFTLAGDYEKADRTYEQALLYNGDDPLLWWAKAANKRLGGLDVDVEEKLELLNAHFLSPLEPCLRAEAFLGLPQTHGKERSTLLESLSEVPEMFIEVACQLIDARMYGDAMRFIDEALRHQSFAMLHYLAAALYCEKSQMVAEGVNHLHQGHRANYPPYPYRLAEKWAISALVARFPDDSVLRTRFMSN
jgi:hypothetical protein